MTVESLVAFTGMVTLLVISPGPNTFLIIKNVLLFGIKKGLLNVIGIVSAICIHGILATLGVSSIIVASATLFSLIKLLGALYLCFIGIRTILESYKRGSISANTSKNPISTNKKIFGNAYTEGLLTNLLNPKPALFYLAIFSQFLHKESTIWGSCFLILIHSAIAFSWYSFIAVGLEKGKNKLLHGGALSKYFQRVSGAVFVYFGLRLAISHE